MRHFRRSIALLAALATAPAIAGEIPGLPSQLPPFLEKDFEVVFSNDFLGRGGSVDDFRTQQIIVSAKLSDGWHALVDQSILTFDGEAESGRVDQLSASLGYEIINRQDLARLDKLLVGFGVRNTGSFSGERMQNGFHRLIGSTIDELAYIDTTRSDITAWIDANHYRMWREAGETGLLGNWRRGYWLRAGSLVTSDGQWDNSASVLAVASRPTIDLWFGFRRDWRTGYEELVLRQTAEAEDDLAIVLGARFGALVIETVQQLNNDASYGQLRLVSSGRRDRAYREKRARFGFEFSTLLPDVQLRLAGKYDVRMPAFENSPWQKSVVIAATYGEPQYKDDNSLFVRSGQLEIGLEFTRPWHKNLEWLSIYAASGAGWREEELIGVNGLQGEASGSVGSATLTAAAGLRFDSAGSGERWRFRTQLGLNGILPLKDAALEIDNQVYRAQRPALNLALGFTLDFH